MSARLPHELLSITVAHTMGDHLHTLFRCHERGPTWDALLTLMRTSPLLHDMALNTLHRSIGTRPATRRTFAPNAPFLATALPKDVRRRLRFIRRLVASDTRETSTRKWDAASLTRFGLENRDANSDLAKAYVLFTTAQAMIRRRAHRAALSSLTKCLSYCERVRPAELSGILYAVVSRRLEDLRLALQLDALGRDLVDGFLMPRDQAIATLTHVMERLERLSNVSQWQLEIGGLPRLLAMMRDNEEYAPVRHLRRRAGALLLNWQSKAAS